MKGNWPFAIWTNGEDGGALRGHEIWSGLEDWGGGDPLNVLYPVGLL